MSSDSYKKENHGHRGHGGHAPPTWLACEPPTPTEQPQPTERVAMLLGVARETVRNWFLPMKQGGTNGQEANTSAPNGEPPKAAPDEPWDVGTLDADEVPPCPKCGSYELWQDMAGTWHCMKCEPPHRSNLIVRKAARFRRLAGVEAVN